MAEDPRESVSPPGLQFPAVARLELDDLLDQLIDRAGEVKQTQGRLRGLLAATGNIAAGLELDELLPRIVESARSLVGARYAALGVIREGRLIRFVHSGMSPELVAAIGDLPEGKGVLGHLIDDPQPLRLRDLHAHSASVGFPAHHPEMRSFLGAPLTAGGSVYGNLYLTEAGTGVFTADDEQLVTALASAAGVAVENALLLADARLRERWQAASAQLTRDLLGDDVGADAALTQLLACVTEVAEAHGAALTRIDPDDPAMVLIPRACGGLAAWAGARAPLEGSITTAALEVGQALCIEDALGDPRTTGVMDRAPEIRSVLAVPLPAVYEGRRESRSVLVVTRDREAPTFGELELEMVGAFAAHAASALAQQQSREDREALNRLQDREQLAHELNDQLMQRLTKVGFALSGVASHAGRDVQRRLLAQVDELDAVVRTVRDTVLRPPSEP